MRAATEVLTVEEAERRVAETQFAWESSPTNDISTALVKAGLGAEFGKALAALEMAKDPARAIIKVKAEMVVDCRVKRLCIVDGVKATTKKENYLVAEIIGECTCGVCKDVVLVPEKKSKDWN